VREILDGTDPTVSDRRRPLGAEHGVRLGLPRGGPFPRIPPSRGTLEPEGRPIRFGRSPLVAFTPLGRSSSGTLYLTEPDGGIGAVVVFGASARIRVWRLRSAAEGWRQ
jgi:hypothetical protein